MPYVILRFESIPFFHSSFRNAIQNNVLNFIIPKTPYDKSLSRAKMSSDSDAAKKRLDAERVTWLAQGFLNRLGYKRAMLRPKKVSLEGEKYLVEVDVQKRTATVQVDLATGEIKGFQIEESVESSFPLSRGMIFLIGSSVGIVVIALIALKVLGFL